MPLTLRTQQEFRPIQRRSFCYLCAREFVRGDNKNRDHVPPSRLFAPEDRDPALILPSHRNCNSNRSAEDEVIGQLVGVLHGRAMVEHGRLPDVRRTTFPDGSPGIGVVGLALKPIIFRWVTGFHAALYNAGQCQVLDPVSRHSSRAFWRLISQISSEAATHSLTRS